MPVAVLLPLDTWQNFYVIVGTAAATLTGLMFLVITLIAQIQISSPRSHVTVFTTSNVFHFGAVLLAAGILSAPWQALWMCCNFVVEPKVAADGRKFSYVAANGA